MGFDFKLNGRTVRVEDRPPTTTLLEFLRTSGLTGSKQGCAEGDCGACTVALVDRDASGKPTYRSVNSCIALLPMFAGREVVTVEGLCREDGRLHPVQGAMVEHYGSQCGYCTPGFVMSLFEGYYRDGCRDSRQMSDQLCGNLCRCTGYRPIRDAALAALGRAAGARAGDPFGRRLAAPVGPPPALDYASGGCRFVRPADLAGVFAALAQDPRARLVAGATEVGVDVTKKAASFPLLVSVEAVPELTAITEGPAEWRIGGAATLTAVGEALGPEYPSLSRMLGVFAARQIRNRATLGGNLATASPIGDAAPVLMTLDAELVLATAGGRRRVPLADFFTGYRRTLLAPGEIILEVALPRFSGAGGLSRRCDFLKVSKRRELDISIVAAAFRVDTDAAGVVRGAAIAYGGVAPTPVRARAAEAALVGRTLAQAADEVARILSGEFRPIDDARGSAGYRRGLVESLWRKFASGEASEARTGTGASPAASPTRPPTPRGRCGTRARPATSRGGRCTPTTRHSAARCSTSGPCARPTPGRGSCGATRPRPGPCPGWPRCSWPRTSPGTTTSARCTTRSSLPASRSSTTGRSSRSSSGNRPRSAGRPRPGSPWSTSPWSPSSGSGRR